ncbi:receptor-type tyrosine-protein phosphatase beta-like isoform X2 [Ptychodera flava]|uniref:receptor-type tyrosine-protein phosphatase beta-like isoform X2 n=1 Tax=Ptychodera flava TaxID=63121 RepID=UPI003969F65E
MVTLTATTEPPAAAEINIDDVTDTSISLQWGLSTDSQAVLYVVTVATAGETARQHQASLSDPNTHDFTGLTPGKIYTITVDVLSTDETDTVIQRTLPSAPGPIAITETEQSILSFTWSAASGDFDLYEVSYASDGNEVVAGTVARGDTLTFTLYNLQPSTDYTLSIRTRIGSGDSVAYSEPSTTIQRTTNAVIIAAVTGPDSIDVSWIPREGAIANYEFTYDPADGSLQSPVTVAVSANPGVSLQSLTPGTQYLLSVFIVRQDDSRQRIGQTTVALAPYSPSNLQVSDVSASGATLSFTPPSTGNFDQFRITAEPQAAPAGSGNTQVIEIVLPSDACPQVNLMGLEPDTTYLVTVVTETASTTSSSSTTTFTTAAASEGEVQLLEVTPTTLRVRWIEVTSDFNQYSVSMSGDDGKNAYDIVSKTGTREKLYESLTSGALYTVIVATIGGSTPVSNFVQARTMPLPPGPANVVSATDVTIVVSWQASSGNIDGYEVCYNPVPNGATSSPISVTSTTLTATIDNLDPETEYTISVAAVKGSDGNNKMVSPKQTIHVSTGVSTKPPSPGAISSTALTSTTFTISWIEPSSNNFLHYEVSYTPTIGSPASPIEVEKGTSTLSLSSLIPGTDYVVSIVTIAGSGDTLRTSDPSTQTITTAAGTPGHIDIASVTENSITITWNEPSGTYTEFLVSYDPADGDSQPITLVPGNYPRYFEFTGLASGQDYDITVTSRNGNLDVSTDTVTQQTRLLPPWWLGAPPMPVIQDVTATTAVIILIQPDHDYDSFQVVIEPRASGAGAGTPLNQVIEVPKSGCPSLTVRGLTADSIYEVSVSTKSGGAVSGAAMLSFETTSMAALELAIADVTDSTMDVIWGEGIGDFTQYFIFYQPAESSINTFSVAKDDEREIAMTGLTAGTRYTVFLQQTGVDTDSTSTTQYTKPNTPGNINQASADKTEISINWAAAFGNVDGYEICYYPADGVASPFTVDGVSATITDLVTDKDYVISVAAYVGTGSERVYSEWKTATLATSLGNPGDIIVTDYTDTSISISWVAFTGTDTGYTVQITPTSHPIYQTYNVDANTLEYDITGLTPGEEYRVIVRANPSSADNSVVQRTKPSQPGALVVESFDYRSASLRWSPPTNTRFDVYELTYTPNDGVPSSPITIAKGDPLSLEITSLHHSTQYFFEIVTVVGTGDSLQRSEASLATVVTSTAEPGTITVEEVLTTSIRISWVAHEGTITSYTVSYRATGTAATIDRTISASQLEYTFTSLIPGVLFDLIVTANGPSSVNSVVQRTNPVAPTGLTVAQFTTNTISVVWTPVSNGIFDSYEVYYKELPGGTSVYVTSVPRSASSTVSVTGLSPDVEYEISISTKSADLSSDAATITQRTKANAPAAGAVTVVSHTSSEILITWEVPPSGDPFDNYELEYTPPDGDQDATLTLANNVASQLYTGLRPGVLYTFNVYTKVDALRSNPSSATQRTVPTAPGAVSIDTVGTVAIEISWEHATGTFDNYQITYTPAGGVPSSPILVSSSTNSYTLLGLTPGTVYNIDVVTVSGSERSTVSSIEQATRGQMPGSISVLSYSTNVIRISWVEAVGQFDNYVVTYSPADGSRAAETILSKTALELEFRGLTPGQEYTFGVSTKIGALQSPPSSKTQRTQPMPVQSVSITDTNTTLLELEWVAPATGILDSYEIKYSPVGLLPSPIIVAEGQLSYTLTGLLPDTSYTVEIVTMSGSERSSAQARVERTDAISGLDLYFTDVQTDRMTVRWNPPTEAFASYRVTYSPLGSTADTSTFNPGETELQLTGLTGGRLYTVVVSALDAQGALVGQAVQKQQRTLPNPPEAITIASYSSNSISVSWRQPSVGDHDGYDVFYSPGDGNSDAVTHIQQSVTTYTISGLTPGREYFISVVTTSDTMKSRRVSETQITKPSSVAAINVVEVTSDTIAYTWNAAVGDYDGYNIEYGRVGDTPTSQRFELNDARVLSLSSLLPGTTYQLSIVTTSGTEESDATTEEVTTNPLPASDLTVSDYDGTSVTLTWTQPPSTAFDEYKLSWTPANTNGDTELTVPKSDTQVILQQLTPGEEYTVTLVTKRLSALSQSITATQRTTPTPPGAITINSATTDSLTVSWVAAQNTFDSYEVTYTPTGTTSSPSEVSRSTTQLTLEGLTAGQSYSITIKTKSGDEMSSEVTAADNTVPDVPGDITVDESRPTYIELSFGAADGIVDEYKLTYTPTNGDIESPKVIDADDRNLILTGLSPDTEYTVRVSSKAGNRESPYKEITVSTPDEPVELVLEVSSYTSNTITIGWTRPTGSFTHYHITIEPSDGLPVSPVILTDSRTSQVFTDLTPGEEYVITVQTAIGGTLTNDATDVVTQRLKPAAPDRIIINSADVTENRIQVSWQPSGGIVTLYEITYSPENGHAASPSNVPGTQTSFALTGLTPATQYTITIKAISHAESSQPRQTTRYTKPGSPSGLTIDSSDSTSVGISWNAPSGVVIDKYVVTITPARDDGTTTFDVAESAGSFSIPDLTPGRQYSIEIQTVSVVDGSEVLSDPVTVTQRMAPTPPTSVTVNEEDIGATSVILRWQPSVGDVTEYVISYSPSDTPAPRIAAGPEETSKQIGGLTNGQAYTFSIGSISGALESDAISTGAITTRPYPPGEITVVDVTKSTIDISWVAAASVGVSYEVGIRLYSEPEGSETTAVVVDTFYQFTGLDSFVKYQISVRTVIGALKSQAASKEQTTFPDLPGSVRDFSVVLEDNSYVVSASFRAPEKANGIISEYIVTYTGTREGDVDDGPETIEIIADTTQNVYAGERLGVFRAGYTYSFTIVAQNSIGQSAVAVASIPATLTMPVVKPGRPEYSADELERRLFVRATHTTITIRLYDDLFADENDVIVSYAIIVAEADATRAEVGATPNSYKDVQDLNPVTAYQTSEAHDYFATTRRRKRSVTTDYMIGDEDCDLDTTAYCNGQLQPLTRYVVKIRAFITNGEYTDTEWSAPMSTRYDPWWFGYAVIGIVGLGIIVILMIVCWRCCCSKERRRDEEYLYRRESSRKYVGVDNPAYIRNDTAAPTTYVLKERVVKKPKQRIIVQAPPSPEPVVERVVSVKSESKSSNLARPVRISNFADHYRLMAADSDYKFQEEYDDLRPVGTNFSTRIGEMADNKPKNRYSNILPYDHTRVKLQEADEDMSSDYINANYISGYNSPREYIATQGPLPTTKEEFWRMVWEQNTTTIVMITQCVEKGRVKCDHYWPFDSDPTDYGDITVTMTSESALPEWTVRDFTLEKNRQIRAVRHFQFTAWPDHGVPETSDALLRFVRTVRGQIPRSSGPSVVHCSAGVGRSGTFIALDYLLQHLAKKDNEFVDVFRLVANMRQKRCFMVQTESQYIFIHRAVLDVLQGRVSDSNWLLTPSQGTSGSYAKKSTVDIEYEPNDK